MSLLDFFTSEAGAGRRAWLTDKERRIAEFLNRALPRNPNDKGSMLDPVVGLTEMLSPATDVVEAGHSGGDLMNAVMKGSKLGALRSGSNMVANTASMMLPGNFNKATKGVMSMLPTRSVGDNQPPPNMRIGPLESVDYPPGFFSEYRGAAPNRTESYPRYKPPKTTDRMRRLELSIADKDNPINKIFDSYIDKGKALGGLDWYNTEELRDWFVGVLGKTEGDKQWREFLELVGTTSTGAKVPQNIRFASFYRALAPEDRIRVAQLVKDKGVTPLEAAKELGVEPANIPDNFNYGHLKQRNQASNVVNREMGLWDREVPEGLTGAALSKWLQANPKVKGFGNDLLGDGTNIAADMHFMRMLAMADGGGDFLSSQAKLSGENARIAAEVIGPRRIKNYTSSRMVNGKEMSEINLFKAWKDGHIKDTSPFQEMPTAWADTPKSNEYSAYEDMANRVAARYGMTPAQFQASLWMGAGDITGLADESQGTFMDLFRRGLDKRAGERNLTRKEMLYDFIKNKGLLAVPAAGSLGLLGYMKGNEDERGGSLY